MNSKKAHRLVTDESTSPIKRYQNIVVGDSRLGFTIKYELITGLFGSFPGAMGLWLRNRFYSQIIQFIGRGVVFGKGTVFHYPQRTKLGDRVAISYNCLLDARGNSNKGITIGNDVIIGRNTSLICKDGEIKIGNNVGIGANSTISAVAGNSIDISENVLIAPNGYLGGISYHTKSIDKPIVSQGIDPKGGIRVGKNSWLGVNVTILDGVDIGQDVIVAAGAVVTKDIPAYGVAMGIPAKIVKYREKEAH
jgi:acetyltransferase-like isoleucine patch superfamily enzyme